MGIPNVSPFERAQVLVKNTLESYVPGELALMDLESADWVMPRPDKYVIGFSVEETAEVVVEVKATGAFPDAAQTPMEFSFGRFTTQVLVDVAVVVRRDQSWDLTKFDTVLMRYAAAFLRLLVYKQADLGGGAMVIHTLPGGSLRQETDQERDPSGRQVRRIVLPFKVSLQELIT